MGDWLRNSAEKATGTRGQLVGPGVIGGCKEQPPIEADTYSTLGIEKTDAFRLQRLYDWATGCGIAQKRQIHRRGINTRENWTYLKKRRVQNRMHNLGLNTTTLSACNACTTGRLVAERGEGDGARGTWRRRHVSPAVAKRNHW